MNLKFPRLTRRRFLFMGGGTALSALLGGAYLISACPLSDSGVCVGPCAAYLDLNHDGICDRIQERLAAGRVGDPRDANALCLACPFGIANDPFPGQCRHYIDHNNNSICDLSEENSCTDETLERPAQRIVPPEDDAVPPCTACPLGLVNDPYPGECRHYVDRNGDGICDLSEPGSCTGETIESHQEGRGRGGGRGKGGGQKRRGQQKDGP